MRHDAGIGHDHVEVSELANTLLEDRLQRFPIAHVSLPGDYLPTDVLDIFRCLLEVLRGGERIQV